MKKKVTIGDIVYEVAFFELKEHKIKETKLIEKGYDEDSDKFYKKDTIMVHLLDANLTELFLDEIDISYHRDEWIKEEELSQERFFDNLKDAKEHLKVRYDDEIDMIEKSVKREEEEIERLKLRLEYSKSRRKEI